MFHYIVLRSETKNPQLGIDFIIKSEPLSRDLPSLRSREGMGVSMYVTKVLSPLYGDEASHKSSVLLCANSVISV